MGKLKDHLGDGSALAEFRFKAHEDGSKLTEYVYKSAGGKHEFTIARADLKDGGKKIRPFHPDGSEGYPKGDKAASRPLYDSHGLARKPSGAAIVVVEGEKCVKAARRVFPDAVVTTWAGGSKAIDKTDWKQLETDSVLLIADTDEPGRNAMRKIHGKLKRLHCTVRVYCREGDDRSDIHDWAKKLDREGREELAAEIKAKAGKPPKQAEAAESDPGGELFPKYEAWPDPVKGEKALGKCLKIILRYMHMEDGQAAAVALWCAMTHIHGRPEIRIAPFLNLTGPTKAVGKSRLAEIVSAFVCRPLVVSSVSASALFRVIAAFQPTLIMDEVDQLLSNKETKGDITGILNGSQSRKHAQVYRSVKMGEDNDWGVAGFPTWSPKLIAGIGGLLDTTLSRCIRIDLKRKPPRRVLPYLNLDDTGEAVDPHRMLARWCADQGDSIAGRLRVIEFPPGLDDRQKDAWRPLLAIADEAGGEWPENARKACVDICASTASFSKAELLLDDIAKVYEQEKPQAAFIRSLDLCEKLNWLEDRPWGNLNGGRGINAHNLGKMLGSFGIKAEQKRVADQPNPVRGYSYEALSPVLKRYSVTRGPKPLKNKEKATK